MRRALAMAAVVALAARSALAQAPPPPPNYPQPPPPAATQNELGHVFGEREPGDGDEPLAPLPPLPPPTRATPKAPEPRINPNAPTGAYDARVDQSFRAAEGFAGPLEGGWTLSAAGEGALFDIRFVDRDGKLEAAWRDLKRQGALDASGVANVTRDGPRLTVRFSRRPGVEAVATLMAAGAGWSGDLDENGRKRPVTLAKTSP